jgi:uncharacterized protein YebE (UPF0316 family)
VNRVRVLLICLSAVVVTVGAGAVFGVLPWATGYKSARPPCEQLPNRSVIVDAVAAHEDLVTRIRNVGPGVTIAVAAPCEGQPDRAIVHITFATDAERKGVDAILRQDGFGVTVELVKK